MLVHSFDRFYVEPKFILPTIGDLNFSKLNYDDTCAYMDNKNAQNTEQKHWNKKIYARFENLLQENWTFCSLL